MTAAAEPRRSRFANGSLLVIGFLGVFVLGWFAYRTTIPPTWLRDFGQQIALHATPDPNAPLPEDSRQVTPRDPSATPYICGSRALDRPWDRLIIVPSGADARKQAILAGAVWPADLTIDQYAEKLLRDQRYQGLVLLQDNRVVAAENFFTFWADLSALARPEGFTPSDAIFTAKVAGGTYVLSVAADAPPELCAP